MNAKAIAPVAKDTAKLAWAAPIRYWAANRGSSGWVVEQRKGCESGDQQGQRQSPVGWRAAHDALRVPLRRGGGFKGHAAIIRETLCCA
jgi:hypothetical protein